MIHESLLYLKFRTDSHFLLRYYSGSIVFDIHTVVGPRDRLKCYDNGWPMPIYHHLSLEHTHTKCEGKWKNKHKRLQYYVLRHTFND